MKTKSSQRELFKSYPAITRADTFLRPTQSLKHLREILSMQEVCIVQDYPDSDLDSMYGTSEGSYEVGKLHGLQLAVTALERLERLMPDLLSVH